MDMEILAITGSKAKSAFSTVNYSALESGGTHTITTDEITRSGTQFATVDEARAYLRSNGGGWFFDDNLDSNWEPDDDDPEEMNDDRAKRAATAIRAFRKATRTDPEDALADLLCDLAHWCDREGISFDEELNRAMGHYPEEAPNGKQFERIEILGAMEGPEPDEDDCDCADRSWYGPQHDTACPLYGKGGVK